MNRRDMVFETCLALFAVTAIVVGNFLVQRWWSTSQTARVADAAADPQAEQREACGIGDDENEGNVHC